jgi:hypothetical protein
MTYYKDFEGPKGYLLRLDRREVFLDDPGLGTPALVQNHKGDTVTYWCALGEGEIVSRSGDCLPIPRNVMTWLESLESDVNQFLYP